MSKFIPKEKVEQEIVRQKTKKPEPKWRWVADANCWLTPELEQLWREQCAKINSK